VKAADVQELDTSGTGFSFCADSNSNIRVICCDERLRIGTAMCGPATAMAEDARFRGGAWPLVTTAGCAGTFISLFAM
jgi:hypothetical protein